MSATRGALVVPPGGGRHHGNLELLCLSEDSPRLNVGVITVAPGRHGPPAHEHTGEDDSFYVLDGELVFLLGEDEEVVAGPGTFVLVPPGVRHTWTNRSGAVARLLNVHAPAGFDRRVLADLA
jgi:mannose-6-phosphate isomerase-like protein (cupin superfamily)